MAPRDPGTWAGEVTFFPIADGGIVYLGRRQRLYGLNATAALIWCDLIGGAPPAETAARLAETFGIDAATAGTWRDLALASFEETIIRDAEAPGDAAGAPHDPAPRPFDGGVTYRLLDQSVHVAAPPDALASLDTLLGHLRADGAPAAAGDLWVSITPEGSSFRVASGGDPPTLEDIRTLAPDVERRIVQDIVPRTPHFIAFHGALMAHGGNAVLLSAPSGSGKTTLAVALAATGWSMLTDEMALLDRALRWRGLPFRPCVKHENYDVAGGLFPRLEAAPEHLRFGRRVKFLPEAVDSRATALRTVIFPEFRPGAAAVVADVAPAAGLQRLLTQCIYVPPGFGAGDVERLVEWHERADYRTLVFGDARAAAELINRGDF